jgi:hypothetical protein
VTQGASTKDAIRSSRGGASLREVSPRLRGDRLKREEAKVSARFRAVPCSIHNCDLAPPGFTARRDVEPVDTVPGGKSGALSRAWHASMTDYQPHIDS